MTVRGDTMTVYDFVKTISGNNMCTLDKRVPKDAYVQIQTCRLQPKLSVAHNLCKVYDALGNVLFDRMVAGWYYTYDAAHHIDGVKIALIPEGGI